MHTIAGSQTAIGILDEALYTVSEFEDIKTSHDEFFDRAMYTNKLSKYIGACNLEQPDNSRLGGIGNATRTDQSTMSGRGCRL